MEIGNIPKSIFYLGAAAHLIQDMTVPQHANNRLLNSHKSYETWIKKNIFQDNSYMKKEGIIRLESLKDYIVENGKYSNIVYKDQSSKNSNNKELYRDMSKILLDRAHTTTAGFLLYFYNKYYDTI